ncbi:MAG: carboxypeptidase-like regulatory domain-containing protein [bacterium]
MRKPLVALLIVALGTRYAHANPTSVPSTPFQSFDAPELAEILGAYGLVALTPAALLKIEDHFASYDSVIAESQSPRHGLQPDVIRFYGERASSMVPLVRSLQEWTTGHAARPAPREGVRVWCPPALVDSLLQEDQSRAEGFLAEIRRRQHQRRRVHPRPAEQRMTLPRGTRFDFEAVEITLHDRDADVRGEYGFSLRGHPLRLYFPFPEDSSLGRPKLLHASLGCDGGLWQNLAIEDSSETWCFGIPAGCREATVRIAYRQAFRNRMTYILRTASQWPQPIGRAELVVRLDSPTLQGARLTLPLEPDSTDRRVFRGTFFDFAPSCDLSVDVQRAEGGSGPDVLRGSAPVAASDVAALLAGPTSLSVSPSPWPAVGVLRGLVRRPTGEAVPFANVIVLPEKIGVNADSRGLFQMDHVPAGRHILRVQHLSMRTAVADIPIYPNEVTKVEVISRWY